MLSNRPANAPQPLPRPGGSPQQRDPSRPPSSGSRGGGHPPNQRGGSGGGGGSNHSQPSPWLGHPLDPNPSPDPTASFIEYLRWMRAPATPFKDGAKVDLVHQAEAKANYGSASSSSECSHQTHCRRKKHFSGHLSLANSGRRSQRPGEHAAARF